MTPASSAFSDFKSLSVTTFLYICFLLNLNTNITQSQSGHIFGVNIIDRSDDPTQPQIDDRLKKKKSLGVKVYIYFKKHINQIENEFLNKKRPISTTSEYNGFTEKLQTIATEAAKRGMKSLDDEEDKIITNTNASSTTNRSNRSKLTSVNAVGGRIAALETAESKAKTEPKPINPFFTAAAGGVKKRKSDDQGGAIVASDTSVTSTGSSSVGRTLFQILTGSGPSLNLSEDI